MNGFAEFMQHNNADLRITRNYGSSNCKNVYFYMFLLLEISAVPERFAAAIFGFLKSCTDINRADADNI